MKKPIVFESVLIKREAGSTLISTNIDRDAILLRLASASQFDICTISNISEMDQLIAGLQKARAAMVEANKLTLQDLSKGDYFRFTSDPVSTIRRIIRSTNGGTTSWSTLEGDIATPPIGDVIRIKATFEDVTE